MKLYEIAAKNGEEIIRGGIKASLETVEQWVREWKAIDDGCELFAVEADENAISEEEYEAEIMLLQTEA